CLITAGIDLSVGANAITVGCLMGMLKNMGVNNSAILLLVALFTGTMIGLINGLMLTRLNLPHPFVSTMGMKIVLCGVALMIVDSKMVSDFPEGANWLGSATIWGSFPVGFLVVIVIYIIMHIFLNRTALGRSI